MTLSLKTMQKNTKTIELGGVKDAVSMEPRRGMRPLKTNSEGKYLSRSFRLCYNKLTDVANIESVLGHFLVDPGNLGWLDLSFNKIGSINSVLCELHELRVLYLHGNDIFNLTDVHVLRKMKNLHTITLHGNPIESVGGYRYYVIFTLPQLKNLDFSGVTRQDRILSNVKHCRVESKKET